MIRGVCVHSHSVSIVGGGTCSASHCSANIVRRKTKVKTTVDSANHVVYRLQSVLVMQIQGANIPRESSVVVIGRLCCTFA